MQRHCDCILDRLQDPDRFCESAEEEQHELRAKLQRARDSLKAVEVSMEVSRPRDYSKASAATRAWTPPALTDGSAWQVKLQISEICSLLDVDGIRGDIVTNRAARALVAFEGRDTVTMEDVKRVIGLCVNHR